MQHPRISNAQVVDDFTLLIEFSNKELRKYDFHRLLTMPMFTPLKNPAFFKSFQVESGGYALVWNEDIDVSEHELWTNGIRVENSDESFRSIEKKALSVETVS
ncbi:MAG: DUF2442 domain-containing protein [Cyanobacteria bacterium J06634_5]